MKSQYHIVSYVGFLRFELPKENAYIDLPVIKEGESCEDYQAWEWNLSLDSPTLKQSVKAKKWDGTVTSFMLINGVCKYLDDSLDGNAGVEMLLPTLREEYKWGTSPI